MRIKIYSTSGDISYGEWSKTKPKWYLSKLRGFKPKIENDGRVADGEKFWFVTIEINSLEDLMKLSHRFGALIIYFDKKNPNASFIEIYDDYRE